MKKIHLLIIIIFGLLLMTNCVEDDDGMNNDGKPDINISDLEVTEGDTDNTISLKVTLSGTNEGSAIVNYATLDQSATSGADYSSTDGTLTFGPGETEKTISIEIKGDELEEPEERFEVLLLNPINANTPNSKAVITILDDDDQTGGGDLVIPTTGYTTPLSYPGYTLQWSDEFQSSTLSEDCWNYEIGNGASGWGNNELQYYKSENTFIADNEYLVIEAKEEVQSGFNYTSSRLTTQGKKSFKYGRVDIRAVLPKSQGLWPALWMLGDNISSVGWPACGEIDVMELIGGSAVGRDDTVHGTIHWDNAGSHANFGNGHSLSSGIYADEFHVFSIVWDETQIVWYMDDIQYHIVDITPSGLSEFHNPFFFIFNVAVGGNWPGSPNSTSIFPQRMIVDYIRVFQ